jgi:hypothetical protein
MLDELANIFTKKKHLVALLQTHRRRKLLWPKMKGSTICKGHFNAAEDTKV